MVNLVCYHVVTGFLPSGNRVTVVCKLRMYGTLTKNMGVEEPTLYATTNRK